MPVRSQPIDSAGAAFKSHGRRIRTIEDALRDRLIPPGYTIDIVSGNLVVTRKSDGATSTLVFA